MEPRIALNATDERRRLALVRAFERAPIHWDVFLWSPDREFDVLVGDGIDGVEAVAFDESAPADCLGSVSERIASGSVRVICVTGARRGCGVSTLALHLSAALADTNEVCLLDLDPDSSLRARLDLPEDARHWGDVGDGVLGAAVPIAEGFRVLLAPPTQRGDAGPILRAATARFGHLVVDAPRGPWRAPALSASSVAMLVVPPSRQGIAHARTVMRSHPDVSWSCVVNRLGPGGELTQRAIARGLECDVDMELPASPYLRDREDDHRLLTSRWSRYYRRVVRLAAAVG